MAPPDEDPPSGTRKSDLARGLQISRLSHWPPRSEHHLEAAQGGRGILLGGAPGVRPASRSEDLG